MAGLMKVWVLGSGSRGNATVIDNGSTRLLVDAGFSARELKQRFAIAGIAPQSIDALVITHEHGDHMCGAVSAARRWNWCVHATSGTVRSAPELEKVGARTFAAGDTLTIGTFNVHAVATAHDATEPVGVVATDIVTGARAAVVLDLGRDSQYLHHELRDLDALVLESNHDEIMLARSSYPISVQKRIAGGLGHLSNREAARLARACAHLGLQHLVLAHLSEQCNTSDHAVATASAALARTRFRGQITAATQDSVHSVVVGARRGGRSLQLALAL
jgi:phosphoribosyl 1,2-cyclic phosphodiesterase